MVLLQKHLAPNLHNGKELDGLTKEGKVELANVVISHFRIAAYCTVIVVVVMTVIFVFLPILLMHDTGKISADIASEQINPDSNDDCSNILVESIPDNLTFPSGSPSFQSTYSAWSELIDDASQSIDIASFYWTLLGRDVIPDPSAWQGEETYKKLMSAVKDRKIKLRIVMNQPSASKSDNDTIDLAKAGAEVRSINFSKLSPLQSGILHTKLWIIDRKHVYVGSANMDWRSLTQVKELGVMLNSCPLLAYDASKLFEVYWYLGKPDTPIPPSWPDYLSTKFNKDNPMKLKLNGTDSLVYLSSAPPQFCPSGRTGDIDAILDVINKAQKFVYIAVMDYAPMIVFAKKKSFWPVIDDALKRAAIDRRIHIRLLTSKWNHTSHDMFRFLKSLENMNGINMNRTIIEVKLFTVPAFTEAQKKIPYARVNHNKYMVTDNAAYIGTSNWSGDYFTSTAGVGFVINQTSTERSPLTVQSQLLSIFERDWMSKYATPLH